MDVPPKFAIPLLLVALCRPALPGCTSCPPSSSVAPVATRPFVFPRPRLFWHQDEAALARQADEAIAIGRARQAAAQAERDAADFDLARMRDQKTAGEVFRALGTLGPTDPKRLRGRRATGSCQCCVREDEAGQCEGEVLRGTRVGTVERP